MKIQRMTREHLDGVLKIENECFSHPWSRESLLSELDNPTSVFFVASENNAVIGYIGMSAAIDEGYIFNVAVKRKNYYRDPEEDAVLMTKFF